MTDLPLLTPETVSRWICFDRRDRSWEYDPKNGRTIQNIQTEGVAGIWNLLATQNGLALLADEVGMGKTVQALGILGFLWIHKPGARVLVVAPNQAVAENWATEYKGFIRDHVRHSDDFVKSQTDQRAIHTPVLCASLEEVVWQFTNGDARFVITKISIFSHLTDRDMKATARQKEAAAGERAAELRNRLTSALGQGLDLLVVDEAHYLRNLHGVTQRVAGVRAFLGKAELGPLADLNLLMTATPNHTTNDDISNIVSYFQRPDGSSAQILNRHSLRRLRLLENKNKYQYREESAQGCSFDGDVPAEIFFALYQKNLAEAEEDCIPVFANERRGFLYGYLEGFETVRGDQIAPPEDSDTQDRSDYHTAPDSDILRRLASQHYGIEGTSPRHPKYDRSMDELVPGAQAFWNRQDHPSQEDKHLVFVRRIPSCRELAARANEAYDQLFLHRIFGSLGLDPQESERMLAGDLRSQLSTKVRDLLGTRDQEDASTDSQEQEPVEESSAQGGFSPSRVMDYFRKVKGSPTETTHGSLFRVRFQRPKELFSLFFETPWDPDQPSLPSPGSRAQYREWIQRERLKKLREEFPDSQRLLRAHWRLPKSGGEDQNAQGSGNSRTPTLASIYHRHMGPAQLEAWKAMLAESPCVQEAFFQTFLRKGLLLASGAIVELYSWFLRSRLSGSPAESVYAAFCAEVDRHFSGSLTQSLMTSAMASFRTVAEGCAGISSGHEILQYSWNELNAHDPGAFCSGEVADRSRLITSFNTPFFPNVLVSTSVLQEGVNLHHHCRKVIHYGIAWTPGDNEQRVGRVDRLFGAVHQNIKTGIRDRLSIRYPYLAGSFDEDQVGQFIMRKHAAEKVLDRGETISGNKTIEVARTEPDWREFLRKPELATDPTDAADPYPYRAMGAADPVWQSHMDHHREGSPLAQHVRDLLERALEQVDIGGKCSLQPAGQDLTWFVEPVFEGKEGREHQPVLVSLESFPELSAQSNRAVFVLQMRSPLFVDRPAGLDAALKDLSDLYPLMQMVCDPNSSGNHFHYHARTCLPVFADQEGREDCSPQEIAEALRQLVLGAEALEARLASGQDLTLQVIHEFLKESGAKASSLQSDRSSVSLWSKSSSLVWEKSGELARLPLGNTVRPSMDLLEIQGKHPFLFGSLLEAGAIAWELRFPAFDFQASEQALLGRWGEFLIKSLGLLATPRGQDLET